MPRGVTMRKTVFFALCAAICLAPLNLVSAAVTVPLLTYAGVDVDTMTLTIHGMNLPANAAVYMGKAAGGVEKLTKISETSTTVTAQLASVEGGTYLVALVLSAEEYYTTSVSVAEGPVSFLANLATDTGLANDTYAKIVFDNVQHDTAGVYDASTGIFTAPEDGLYHLDVAVQFTNLPAALLRLNFYLYKNGSRWVSPFGTYDSAAGNTAMNRNTSITAFLNAGDEIEVYAYVNGGTANLDALTNSNFRTFFSAFLVR